jgi:hypothetical protein
MDSYIPENIELIAKDEVFLPVKIYDEIYPKYLISNYGRLYSLKSNKFLRQKTNQDGYMFVDIYVKRKVHHYKVHRLVAFNFVVNMQPDKFSIVHHRDCNKRNNFYINLVWCDYKYNLNCGDTQKKRAAKKSKKIFQFDLDNNLIAEYDNLTNANAITGIPVSTISKRCISGKPYKGYYYRRVS